MKNIAHVAAQFHLVIETDLNEGAFTEINSIDSFVGSIVQLIKPDGSVHKIKLAALTGYDLEEFENNSEQ